MNIINNNNEIMMDVDVKELPNRFYINDFLIDLHSGEITFDGEVQVIEPKVMALLKVVAQAPKQVFSAEVLFEVVWPKAIYSPNSVRRNISFLRQVLGDVDKKIIKTHPKRGYSLEADVRIIKKKTANQIESKAFRSMIKPRYLVAAFFVPIIFMLFLVFSTKKSAPSLSDLQPVTSSNEQERYMQISPDGRFMAYIQNTDQHQKRKLLIKNLETDLHWSLTEISKAYTYLAWSSDQTTLIYSLQNKESISFGRLQLDEQAKVVHDEILFTRNDITWNSWFFIDKNQYLYYLANQNGSEHSRNVSLYKHNLVTRNSEVLIKPNDTFKPYKIALSPEQSQLALIGFDKQGISEVQLLDLANNSLESIGKIDHNWHFLTWFKSGNSLLLSNGSALNRLELNGKLTTLNYKSYNFLLYPQIVEDRLYFIERKSDQDILISTLNSFSQPQKVINSNTVDKDPSLSSDEKFIAYLSMKNGLPQLFIKEIETGNERLIFANKEQEFALSKPVWDKKNKRIASSINNKPFIIHLERDLFSLEWLDVVLGVPIAWYTQSDAILFVDKRNHNDALIKLTLKDAQTIPLNIQPQRKKFFLDNSDRLLFFADGQVVAHQSDEVLLPKSQKISLVYPNDKGFFYRFEAGGKARLQFYDYLYGIQKLSTEFEMFCEQSCEQITTIGESIILLNENRSTADILKLNVSNL